jgi:hypothetical protein
MPESQRRPILANGEKYVREEIKKSAGRPPEMPRPYPQARDRVRSHVKNALEKIASLPNNKRFKDEAVLCLRLHPDMMAKTYDPRGIFAYIGDLENVGSRNYKTGSCEVAQTKRIKKQLEKSILEVTGRMVFVRSTQIGFRRLIRALDESEQKLPNAFREDIQRIEKFDLLDANEQLLGFGSDWKEGRVEMVFHPTIYTDDEQKNFLKELFRGTETNWNKVRIATYPFGPTFVSCRLNRNTLAAIACTNPLRTVHPLVFNGVESLRSSPTFRSPAAPNSQTRSTIKIGMFDGGIDPAHPLLKGHVEQDDGLSTKNPASADHLAHGTAVAGAILFGPLNGYDVNTPLPQPKVSVVSIRALPTSDPSDIDLYEAIEVIERAVPSRPDIKVFNISFGPRGPILDDEISRFTYALDSLATANKVTFCVAVGNDGEAGPGLDRIQAPSDIVNGLGVGAHTTRNGRTVHAPYSCKGPGRECGKIKPDLVAFGGCDQQPIQLISHTPGLKLLNRGTSFASPIVASLSGQAVASYDRGTALLSRALLIHTAQHPEGKPDHLFGHGLVQPSLDDIFRCQDQEVTILFQGDILPRKMVRLPILLPLGLNLQGNVNITWTIAVLPLVSPNHPSDYTLGCIEDTFYPNTQVFNFTTTDNNGKIKSKRLHLNDDADKVLELRSLGWNKSSFPATQSGNRYPTEQERRSLDYKWETIVRHNISKRAASLHDPFLILHAIPRNEASARMDYAAIVTISAPKYSGDLYNDVLRRFTALQPIRIRSQEELRVRIQP